MVDFLVDFSGPFSLDNEGGKRQNIHHKIHDIQGLVIRPKQIPPPIPSARHLSHDPCRTVLSVVSQTIAATSPLLSSLGGGHRRESLPLKPIAL